MKCLYRIERTCKKIQRENSFKTNKKVNSNIFLEHWYLLYKVINKNWVILLEDMYIKFHKFKLFMWLEFFKRMHLQFKIHLYS